MGTKRKLKRRISAIEEQMGAVQDEPSTAVLKQTIESHIAILRDRCDRIDRNVGEARDASAQSGRSLSGRIDELLTRVVKLETPPRRDLMSWRTIAARWLEGTLPLTSTGAQAESLAELLRDVSEHRLTNDTCANPVPR